MFYRGNFSKGLYQGLGTLFYPDGAIRYFGQFNQNKSSG